MYVCICRAVTSQTVRNTIAEGAIEIDEIERRCGAGGDCGSCRAEISDLLDELRACPCEVPQWRSPRASGSGALVLAG